MRRQLWGSSKKSRIEMEPVPRVAMTQGVPRMRTGLRYTAEGPRIDYHYFEGRVRPSPYGRSGAPLRQAAGTPVIPPPGNPSRRPDRGRTPVRRNAGRMAPREHSHHLPHLRLLQNGPRRRSDGGGGPVLPGAGASRACELWTCR